MRSSSKLEPSIVIITVSSTVPVLFLVVAAVLIRVYFRKKGSKILTLVQRRRSLPNYNVEIGFKELTFKEKIGEGGIFRAIVVCL
jgi:hypothetical protein